MAEIVPVTKDEHRPAATQAGDNYANAGEPQAQDHAHDALQPVRDNVAAGGGEQRLERSGYVATQQAADWQPAFRQALANVAMLQRLDGVEGPVDVGNGQVFDADQLRAAFIKDGDRSFQAALIAAQQSAPGASAEMFQQLAQAENTDGRMQALMRDPEVTGTLQQLGLNNKQLSPDDIQNAILNAPTDNARNKLTEYFTLSELQNELKGDVGNSLLGAKAPSILSLAYAEFVMENKGGVTTDLTSGQPVSAKDILLSATYQNPDLAAHPDAQSALQRAGDQQVQGQSQLVPGDQNPLAMLNYAVQTGDLNTFQQAYQLAQDKKFDPQTIQKQIDELKKQPDSQDKTQKLSALQDLSHARAMTEGYLGLALLQQPNPDLKTAQEHLTNAMADPVVVTAIQDGRGNAVLPSAMQQAVFMQNPDFQGWTQTFNNDMQAVIKAGQNLQVKDGEKAQGPQIDQAIASAQDAYNKAEMIQKALGPNADKIEKEYKDLKAKKDLSPEEKTTLAALQPFHDALHYKTQAAVMLATFDSAKGDPYAAKKLLDEAAKDKTFLDDPEHANMKQQVEALQKASDAQIHNIEEAKKPWYLRAADWVADLPGKAWDWMKDHAKLIAMGVGIAAAIAITVGTGGLGAPAGVAIVAGIAGGGILGASAGGGLEVASGKAKTFWQGFKDTAPSAFQGSAIGATLVGFAPVAAGAGAAETAGAGAVAETTASSGLAAETAAGTASAAETTATAANAGRVAQMTARAGEWAKGLPGIRNAVEGANAVRNTELVTNFMNSGRVMTFANMENATVANMARFGSIAAISGVPANWDSLRKGEVGNYFNYVGTGTLFGLGGRAFLAADAGKNAVTELGNPHGDNFGVGSYLRNVAFDTAGDGVAKLGGKVTPGYGYFYPQIAQGSRDSTNMLYHFADNAYENHFNHQLSTYQIRMMNLTPDQVRMANEYLQHPDAPAQPAQPAQSAAEAQPGYGQYVTGSDGQPQQVTPAPDAQPTGDPGSASSYQQYLLNDNNNQ